MAGPTGVPKMYQDPADANGAVAGATAILGRTFVIPIVGSLGNYAKLGTCGSGAAAIGVASKDTPANQPLGVISEGTVEVLVSTVALVEGAPIMSDANGKAILWTTGNHRLGSAMGPGPANGSVPCKMIL